METFQSVKIEIFIPEEFIEPLRDGLLRANAGRIGNYAGCVSISTVRGYWTPLEGATPYQGAIGETCFGQECKVEVNCRWEDVPEALKAIHAVHPYEEPLINVIPLVNHLFPMAS